MFKDNDVERADWQLLQNGAVTLFWKSELYFGAIKSLQNLGYETLEFLYEEQTKFFLDVSSVLKWNEQFGYAPWSGNLNAFNDGLRGEPFNSSNDTAICVERFDKCVSNNADWAVSFLDILEYQSRNYLLHGKRLIVLIQTNDPNFHCKKLGGRDVQWNIDEWMNSSRGV